MLNVGGSRSWGKVRLVVWWYLGATPATSKRVIPVVSHVTSAHWDESLALLGGRDTTLSLGTGATVQSAYSHS